MILAQSAFTIKYNMIPKIAPLATIPIIILNGVVLVVLLEMMFSINGLPSTAAPQTIPSFNRNLPAKIAVANFHGLYFARPNGIYTRSSGIGVNAAIKAPSHPYLLKSLCSGAILFLVFVFRILRP